MPSTNVGYKSNKLEAGKLQIILGACLACEADFERVARDTLAMADKCEADVSRANGGPDLTPSDAFWV